MRRKGGFCVYPIGIAARINAECAGSESYHLNQTPGHGDILHQVDELILVANDVMKRYTRDHGEDRQNQCGNTCLIAQCKQKTADDFHGYGDR